MPHSRTGSSPRRRAEGRLGAAMLGLLLLGTVSLALAPDVAGPASRVQPPPGGDSTAAGAPSGPGASDAAPTPAREAALEEARPLARLDSAEPGEAFPLPLRVLEVAADGAPVPVADAELELALWFAGADGQRREERSLLRTDDQGQAALLLPPGRYGLQARHGERASPLLQLEHRSPADAPHELRLGVPGATIRIRVLSPDGAPAPGAACAVVPATPMRLALMRFSRDSGGESTVCLPTPGATVPVTDARGDLVLQGVAPGCHILLARIGSRLGRALVTVGQPGERLEASLSLEEQAPVASLRVGVEPSGPHPSGAPLIATLKLTGSPPRPLRPGQVLTVEDLDAGPVSVRVSAPGWSSQAQDLTLVAGEVRDLLLRLEPASGRRGRVVLPDGGAATAGWVADVLERVRVPIAADGGFSLAEFEAEPQVVTVSVPGWLDEFRPLDPAAEDVRVQLAGGEVSREVKILSPDGLPWAGLLVQSSLPSTPTSGVTDEAGRLRVGGPAGQRVRLSLRSRVYEQRFEVDLVPGPELLWRVAAPRPKGEPARLSGRVLDEVGRPLPGVFICQEGPTDAEGRFQVEVAVEEAGVLLFVFRADHVPLHALLPLVPGERKDGLELRLTRGVGLALELRGLESLRGRTVSIDVDEATGENRAFRLVDLVQDQQRVDLGRVAPGRYLLRLKTTGAGQAWRSVHERELELDASGGDRRLVEIDLSGVSPP